VRSRTPEIAQEEGVMRQRVSRIVALGIVVTVLLVAPGASPQSGRPVPVTPTVTAQAVHGLSVGPGRKLWVLVFPARGGGKPGGGTGTLCTDNYDTGTQFNTLGSVLPGPVTFKINEASIPIDNKSQVIATLQDSFQAWETATGKTLFDVESSPEAAATPAADQNNTVGWVKIVPKNVLAATWIWTVEVDGTDYVEDVDVFYNAFQPWGVLTDCSGTETRFDIGNVGVHEIGHVIGLDHVSDASAMATMYPSAPKGEVKKRTLTTSDMNGAESVTSHFPANQ
jgi:hypothetical protein